MSWTLKQILKEYAHGETKESPTWKLLKLDSMWDEEAFALKWLETEDIYEALNLSFIEEKRLQKMSTKDKGNVVVVDEGEEEDEVEVANEERFQQDLLQATMISGFETSLPEGEPSKRAKEEEVYEEQLMDYE